MKSRSALPQLPVFEQELRASARQAARGFPTEPASVKRARDLTRSTLAAWRLPAAVDDAVTVVSELMGNAVRHAAGERVELVLTHGGGLLLVEVRDGGARPPVPARPTGDDESGRGLQLVHALASDWGWLPLRGGGKAVWALLEAHHAAAGCGA
ncbi:ATP-binding protein [Streptomyces sp. NPDC051561]|uniref:ATP-binding protein n=1 Tax=Streptomyces sp. NPDC051561 TaxID=3365658 RepID=UPI00379E1139